MNFESKINQILETEWEAAEDQSRLAELRSAFERTAADYDAPVYIRGLTATQIARIEDLWAENSGVIASGATWILFNSPAEVSDASDLLQDRLDEYKDFALQDINKDLTEAQEAFIESRVQKSVMGAVKILQKNF